MVYFSKNFTLLKWVSCKQYIVVSCFFIQSDKLCLLVEVLKSFIFIHSPTKTYLGCFQVLAIMKGAINIHVQIFCRHRFSVPLGKYQGE